jgi:N-dimethylarginine dimethylaminohydrolase
MQPKTPSDLSFPAYLMNFPFTVNNNVINNPLMLDYEGQTYDYNKAFQQFFDFYTAIAASSVVSLLPSSGNFQDQTYVANVACYLPHQDIMVLANFKSEPRIGEEEVASEFFEMMGYRLRKPHTTFEGEADLKYIRDNLYIGGYGIRTQIESYRWMAQEFGTDVIPIKMNDEKLYHFDCMFLPLPKARALVATSVVQPDDLRILERYFNIISVPKEHLYDAYTNCLVKNNKVYHSPVTPNTWGDFESLISKLDLEPVRVNLSEFEKSGASLSCLILHLNYEGRNG